MTTITLEIGQSTDSTATSVQVVGQSDSALDLPAVPAVSRAIPPLTDPEQAYFWSPEWQAAEQAADADLAAGRAQTFTTLQDTVRWLLSDD